MKVSFLDDNTARIPGDKLIRQFADTILSKAMHLAKKKIKPYVKYLTRKQAIEWHYEPLIPKNYVITFMSWYKKIWSLRFVWWIFPSFVDQQIEINT